MDNHKTILVDFDMTRSLNPIWKRTKISENQNRGFAFHSMTNTSTSNTSASLSDPSSTIPDTDAVYEDITSSIIIIPNFGITLTGSSNMTRDSLLDLQKGDGDN